MLAMPRAARCPCHAARATRRTSSVSKPGSKATATLVAHQHRSLTFALVFFTMSDGDEHFEPFIDSWPVMSTMPTKIILGNKILFKMIRTCVVLYPLVYRHYYGTSQLYWARHSQRDTHPSRAGASRRHMFSRLEACAASEGKRATYPSPSQMQAVNVAKNRGLGNEEMH